MKLRQCERMFCAVLLLFSLAACGTAAAPPGPPSPSAPTWEEQYDLGVRFLTDGNYEEAIIAFTAAIEIDPKQPPAFVGRGDAYRAQGEKAGDEAQAAALYEQALADYQQAQTLGAEDVQGKYDAVQEQLNAAQEKLNAALAREKLCEDSLPLLQALYACFAAGDREGAKALMRQEEYRAMSADVAEGFPALEPIQVIRGDGSPLAYDGGGENWLAVYPWDHYYFGQFVDGQRSGQGLWICAAYDDDDYWEICTYEGEWLRDMPNGKGTEIEIMYPEKMPDNVVPHTETQGEYLDGLHHGTILLTFYRNDGGVHIYTPITAVNGVYQPVPGGRAFDDGWYQVAEDQNGIYGYLPARASIHYGIVGWKYEERN